MLDEDLMSTVETSTDLLLVSVDTLTDAQVKAPTLLPGWTRAHLLTHLARAAESLGRLLDWASTGVEQPQYASMDARAAEIEAGARRTGPELAADIRRTAAEFEAKVRSLPTAAWAVEVRPRTGEPATPSRLVWMRLRELEVHHADLDVGYTFADIPEALATQVIDDILGTLAARDGAPPVRLRATDTGLERELGEGGPLLTGGQSELLAWLSGRSPGAGLTVEGADEVPPAACWI